MWISPCIIKATIHNRYKFPAFLLYQAEFRAENQFYNLLFLVKIKIICRIIKKQRQRLSELRTPKYRNTEKWLNNAKLFTEIWETIWNTQDNVQRIPREWKTIEIVANLQREGRKHSKIWQDGAGIGKTLTILLVCAHQNLRKISKVTFLTLCTCNRLEAGRYYPDYPEKSQNPP